MKEFFSVLVCSREHLWDYDPRTTNLGSEEAKAGRLEQKGS